ncbi:hypothetical protein CTAYLR_006140 [Chrysophaeum taylorii]|uniref:lycopene beta-cyclase n=1 Tax=Chrysophaeum taylorii TaxID=2483200 RepID=A0AAD7XQC7_9STRA|nr:hypothetical protein CTAYLR_006140 [Chrysophaeum taylorii]
MLLLSLGATVVGAWTQPAGVRRRLGPIRSSSENSGCSLDVAVVGAGPAGSVLAWRLAHSEGLKVGLISPDFDAPWTNNYGVWTDEWEKLAADLEDLDLGSCVSNSWPVTDCFFGGSWGRENDERTRIERGYSRVDREALRRRLRADPAVTKIRGTVEARASDWCSNVYSTGNVAHDLDGTTLKLKSSGDVRAKVVVDATGVESTLTTRGPEPSPVYQIAYGFAADVEGCPYDRNAMVLFDYRTDHLDGEEPFPPTFVYVMPLDGKKVFFEETVLVSRPALSMAECERRLDRRLDRLGVRLVGPKEEVELCYIPMGGPLPDPRQRVVAFGAAAGLVHPATGYQLCRALAASGDVASALGTSLRNGETPDAAAAAAYAALWGRTTKLQRDFALFGGEFLLGLDAPELRGWFNAFFALPQDVWAGFLAFWPGLPGNHHHETRLGRLGFGLKMFFNLPPQIAIKLVSFIAFFSITRGSTLLQSVVPFFGDGDDVFQPLRDPARPYRDLGDLPIKAEIRHFLGIDQDPPPLRDPDSRLPGDEKKTVARV